MSSDRGRTSGREPVASGVARDSTRTRRAILRQLGRLVEPTQRLRTYTAFAFWTLAGGRARRPVDPAVFTATQRLVFLAAAHHADCAPGKPVTAADVAVLAAIPHDAAAASLRRLARFGWLRTRPEPGCYAMPAAAVAFVATGALDDPLLFGEPLIEVLFESGPEQPS
ncbi:hypothetical protein [Phytohabitans rumicis]|uniref:Uncharacterized protein n=1 Tax=Phytohabitans rumicis TaxID=1076125 RepID=A0A6V8LGV6_9ACTN|nr:hypothetical protein [Phytohabitans rumicis]GFJ93307.1 hypothetical protein Prum_069490 [Phytohabitans rumicis]